MKMTHCFLILITFFLFINNQSWAKVYGNSIEVCPTCSIKEIKVAIEKASPGSVITVRGGVYKEGPIIINKSLELKGEGLPVIDGEEKFQILTIFKADNVRISGFVFQNTGLSYTKELAGVRVIESKNCEISNSFFNKTTYGVYLENSESCRIYGNEFNGHVKDDASGGNAIHAWYGSDHFIEKNKVSGHRDGIYLEFCKKTQIKDNDVRKNLRYGLHFMFSSETEYHRNYFIDNGAGVAVMYSQQIQMYDNHFVNNTGAAAYGLLLKEIHSSKIFRNEFSHNTVAIFMEGSNRSQFNNNLLTKNGWALRVMGNCENNDFSNNDFISNTFDVATNSDHNWNNFHENYWSQNEGYDLNHDGIADRPYRPVSLSSVILEKVDSAFILMNSFFFKLMDQTERALPSLIPEPLKDEAPLMKPISGVVRSD